MVKVKELLEKNFILINSAVNCPSLRNVKYSLKKGNKEIQKENIEAETERAMEIIIYKNVIDTDKDSCLAQTISHEFWHIFTARFKFYHRLEQIYSGKIKGINKLTRNSLVEFLEYFNNMNTEEIDRLISSIQEEVPCWTDAYILDMARTDSRKKFIRRIKHFKARGIVEDMFADAYAEIVSGVKPPPVPEIIKKIVSEFLGL
jgi:hypothetical protein